MAEMGIGQDSYFRVQKESVWGTAVTGSMTLLPVNFDTLLTAFVSRIENEHMNASRVMPAPEKGRKIVGGNIGMDMHPSLIGNLFNFFLGAANGTTNNGDGSYTHNWLQPLTGQRVGTSFTASQAQGAELEDIFSGCVIAKLMLEGESDGNLKITAEVVAKDYTTDGARISSFSYPALIPHNFSHLTFNVNPNGVSAFDLDINSFSLEIDLNLDRERFKMGSDTIKNPVFNGIPTVTMTVNTDSDQQFIDYARDHNLTALTLTITNTEQAGSTPTYYSTVVELPGCILNPETSAEFAPERMAMDLEWNCGTGGTSTNSGSDNVMFEIRHTDATSSYTA